MISWGAEKTRRGCFEVVSEKADLWRDFFRNPAKACRRCLRQLDSQFLTLNNLDVLTVISGPERLHLLNLSSGLRLGLTVSVHEMKGFHVR